MNCFVILVQWSQRSEAVRDYSLLCHFSCVFMFAEQLGTPPVPIARAPTVAGREYSIDRVLQLSFILIALHYEGPVAEALRSPWAGTRRRCYKSSIVDVLRYAFSALLHQSLYIELLMDHPIVALLYTGLDRHRQNYSKFMSKRAVFDLRSTWDQMYDYMSHSSASLHLSIRVDS